MQTRGYYLAPFLTTLLIGLLVLGGLYVARQDDSLPFTYGGVYVTDVSNQPKNIFRPGETFLVHRDLCFLRDITVTFTRKLVSLDRDPTLNVFINSSGGLLKKGCIKDANVLQIPPYTPPGRWRFTTIVVFANNVLQEDRGVVLPQPAIEVIP